MRRLLVWSVLVLAAACAVQNNPLPTGNNSDDESGSAGSGGNAGKGGAGGSTSQAGTVNKAGSSSSGSSSGGKAGAGTGGTTEPQGGDGAGGEPGGGMSGGGMAGKGGTGGSGGNGGVANGGKGGTGGTAGSGGTAGMGGSGGNAGNGGSGGSGGACMAAMSAPVGGLSARYVDEHAGSTPSIGSQIELFNAGPNTLNLADLKVRYYFTNEVTAPLQISINWAWYRAGDIDKKDKVMFNLVKQTCTANNADSYLEFTFKADAGLLEPAHYLLFSWQATNGATQSFTQTNDYSYDAAAKIDTDDSKIVIFQNSGTRAWGTEP